jgi:predicted nucleotidyltransferase
MRLNLASIEAFPIAAQAVLAQSADLAFAVLVGSRANGTAHERSDWDIAIQWAPSLAGTDKWVATELLRQELRHTLQVREDQIDLIDLADARLAMRALVAEEGVPVHIANDLAWVRFLQSTWSQLEDHQWRQQHAA